MESPDLLEANMKKEEQDKRQVVTQFDEVRPEPKLDLGAVTDYSRGDESEMIALKDFMRRPVRIGFLTWTEGGALDTSIAPWQLFFSKTPIINKLNNFYLLKCDLHIKVVVNASPFYYGAAYIAYQPFGYFTNSPANSLTDPTLNRIRLSQRPGIWVYPQDNQGGTMVLPYFNNKEWIEVFDTSEFLRLGTLYIKDYYPLDNANGVVGAGVNISIYAWAENISLAGPTQGLALQAGDEYGTGVISAPASAIANFAGRLSDMPVIGKFATATQMIMSSVSNAATLFGYTKLPDVANITSFYSRPLPPLAVADRSVPIDKLTYDSKNELTIDPKTTGVPLADEMSISSYITRESYLTAFTWSSTKITEDMLFSLWVNPVLYDYVVGTNATAYDLTPLAHMARLFRFWRGDIEIRLKIVCSKYHRGRLEVFWDPGAVINATTNTTVTNFTEIVDIENNTDVRFVIPYTQSTAYLTCFNYIASNNYTAGSMAVPDNDYVNGTFGVKVLNRQTSPVASSDIRILVFVRACDNFEFAVPRNIPNTFSILEPQASKFDVDPSTLMLGVKSSVSKPEINLMYMGEKIVSMRTLFQRYDLHYRIPITASAQTGANVQIVTYTLPRNVILNGYDNAALNSAVNQAGVSNFGYNFSEPTPLSWLQYSFLGRRGALTYNLVPIDMYGTTQVTSVDRAFTDVKGRVVNIISLSVTNNVARSSTLIASGNIGRSLTINKTQTGITVSVPMYSRYKFLFNVPLSSVAGTGRSVDDTAGDTITIATSTYYSATTTANVASYIDLYISAGTDFSLLFFVGVPRVYQYNNLPAAT